VRPLRTINLARSMCECKAYEYLTTCRSYCLHCHFTRLAWPRTCI